MRRTYRRSYGTVHGFKIRKFVNRGSLFFLILLSALLLLLIFSGKIANIFEDFFLWHMTPAESIVRMPEIYLARSSWRPYRNWNIEDLKMDARAAIAVEIKGSNKSILFDKNSDQKLPIASLSKLIAASVIIENYDLLQKIEISPRAASTEGDPNSFEAGEIFVVEDLLYSALMESSNKATFALAEAMGKDKFVSLMNAKAELLGLENTRFFNATGLDPDDAGSPVNFSTPKDLVKLVDGLLEEDLLWGILGTREFNLYQTDGSFHHKVENTNELLTEVPYVWGGKTGWTPRAGECLLLVLRNPENKSFIINVILGSEDRFEEMKKLIDWVDKAYRW